MVFPLVAVMAIAQGATSAASGLLGGIGANKSAQQQASLYNQQAGILEASANNAKIRGQQKVQSLYKEGARYVGSLRANQAKSGLTGVTAQDIETESLQNVYQDIGNLEYDNLVEEINLRNEAAQNRYAAKQAKKAGSSALMSGILSAAGAGISAVGNFSSKGSSCSGSKCAAKGGR